MVTFLVIGAQKSATSWLYYCLKEHPEIYVPDRKLEVEYLGGELYQERGSGWYRELVRPKNGERVNGDVSVEYLFDPRAPKAVKKHSPGTLFFASLREPADRFVSAYYWNARKGKIPFEDVDHVVERIVEMKAAGKRLPAPFEDLIARGFYDRQIRRYLQYFESEQLCLISFDGIKRDPSMVLEFVYQSLGVAADFVPPAINNRPKYNARSQWLIRAERWLPKLGVFSKLTEGLNDVVGGRSESTDEMHLSDVWFEELRNLYRPSLARLRETVESTHIRKSHGLMEDICNWMEDS